LSILSSLAQDFRYALRGIRSSPLFTGVTVLTLAIGIGATTAIFSSVNAMLLRPLPFPKPEELVAVRTRFPDGRLTNGLLSPLEINALENPAVPVVHAAGVAANPFSASLIRGDGKPVELMLNGVTENFFEVLGLPLAIGPGFKHEDFVRTGGKAPWSVILSDHLWAEQFGRDPQVIGKTVFIAELPGMTTIAGVALPAMDFPRGTDGWLNERTNPGDINHGLLGLVRLRPGSGIGALRSAAAGAMAGLGRSLPTEAGREYVPTPLLFYLVGDLRSLLLIVFGATALLLVLACVNVTDLLLARGSARTREFAMRAALGAGRGRLIRQMLAESLVLAAMGAVAGIALAFAGIRALQALGASKLPRLATVPFDARVLAFAVTILLISAIAMGIAPALRMARADLRVLLNEGGRGSSAGRGAARSMSLLIVAEVALAIVMTAGSGWLVQSYARLESVRPGFQTTGRVVFEVKPTRRFSGPAQAAVWFQPILDRVRAIPGVEAAGGASTFPLRADRDGGSVIGVPAEVSDPNRSNGAGNRIVTPGFFAAMGIPLISGRDFTADDRAGSAHVAVVNQAFIKAFLGARDPLFAEFAFGFPQPDPRNVWKIVGVVEDVHYASLGEKPGAAFYTSKAQTVTYLLPDQIVVSARAGDLPALEKTIRRELLAYDPSMVINISPASDIVAGTLARQRLGMMLMTIFGALALLLSAIGIYGVIAYAAAQRRTELATRIALGASAANIFWLVMRSGQMLALAGIALGIVGAYLGGRAVAGSIFAMNAADPCVLTAAAAIVAGLTILATLIPAILASRLDPIRGLRAD
jgi:predicted permease